MPPHFPKPAEGSWTEHWPELGTGPVDYSDSTDPEYYKLEQEAICRDGDRNRGQSRLPECGASR